MKKCTNCKKLKDLKFFCKDGSRGDGLSYLCKDCRKIVYPLRNKKYRQSPKGRKTGKDYRQRNKTKLGKITLQHYHKVRNTLFDILGKNCARCGFSDLRALQIDHKNGNGAQERRKLGLSGFYNFYWKKPELARKLLQILCANCNWIKRSENNEI